MDIKKAQPILNRILIPMVLLTILEVLLLSGTFLFGGAISELNDNAKGIFQGKVMNRAGYLQNEMTNNWSNMTYTIQDINTKAEALHEKGIIDLDHIGDSSESCYPLVAAISEDLIDMLRSNKVTGAFVVFNTDNPDTLRSQESFSKPGVYFRDLDPDTNPSVLNSDLLIERGPVSLVHNLDISTDRTWQPLFQLNKDVPEALNSFLNPLEQGFKNPNTESLSELGYWSLPHTLKNDNKLMISYTLPLITSTGKVYGVIGADITLDYLSKLLPTDELINKKSGQYVLVMKNPRNNTYQTVYSSNENIVPNRKKLNIQYSIDNTLFITPDTKNKYYVDIEYLQLYDSNGPYSSNQWGLAGIVPEKHLTEFSNRILYYIAIAIFLTIVIGIAGSVFVSYMITRPIYQVSKDMQNLNISESIHLSRTNIQEFDQMEISIEKLSRDIIESATKFTQILNQASVKISGFEINKSDSTLFLTDGFFDIFGLENTSGKIGDIHSFKQQMKALNIYKKEASDGHILYRIPKDERDIYIRLSYSMQKDRRVVGIAEDVTNAVLEKQLIEYERDHDLLTGLKNRRSFLRIIPRLFEKGELHLKKAALLMMDLDNLKYINDKYGHDYGDKYIQAAAESFQKNTPPNTIVARISGDEFYLFFYGYEKEEEINQILATLKKAIDSERIILPPGTPQKLKMSGGISWYPRDSVHYGQLQRYSDFAMYQVKHSTKGEISDFDIAAYHSEEFISQNRQELSDLIENEKVEYYYQPIVDARTSKIFAYEALMRGITPTLRNPQEILALAKEEHKLAKIEELTWKKAALSYIEHVKNNTILPDCKVFINSLADYKLSNQTIKLIETKCRGYLNRFVFEITEDAQTTKEAMEVKQILVNRWESDFALDDYGSGYNGERVLLELNPKYIKIDKGIISGIHLNIDKQKIVENIISYARERHIKTIAEGIETEQELKKVIELGIDYVQGYFLARPYLNPPELSDYVVSKIKSLNY
jgi:diguanylate cyclase (GGDEF)-like protein